MLLFVSSWSAPKRKNDSPLAGMWPLYGVCGNAAQSSAALPQTLKQQIYALFQQTAEEVFSWQVVQDRFIELYKNNFSSNDLLSLKKLCSDPDYRAVVDADLRIIPDSLSIGFEFQPELQRRFQRRLKELLQQQLR